VLEHSSSPPDTCMLCVQARIVKCAIACKHASPMRYLRQRRLKVAKTKNSYAVEFARKGGKARAKKLTAEQRKTSARKAAQARWAKQRGKFSRDTET
jgi:hypothetical protein